MLVRTTFMLE